MEPKHRYAVGKQLAQEKGVEKIEAEDARGGRLELVRLDIECRPTRLPAAR